MSRLIWKKKFQRKRKNYKKREELVLKAKMISIPMLMI